MQTRRTPLPRMARSLPAFACAIALAGCVSSNVYYAQGVDVTTRERDFAQCEAQALRDFPYLPEVRFTEHSFVPPTETCTPDGTCTRTGGYFEGGERYTVDANTDLRASAAGACMGAQGYRRISLPYCDEGTAVMPDPRMAELRDGTCVLRRGNAPDLVVNPL